MNSETLRNLIVSCLLLCFEHWFSCSFYLAVSWGFSPLKHFAKCPILSREFHSLVNIFWVFAIHLKIVIFLSDFKIGAYSFDSLVSSCCSVSLETSTFSTVPFGCLCGVGWNWLKSLGWASSHCYLVIYLHQHQAFECLQMTFYTVLSLVCPGLAFCGRWLGLILAYLSLIPLASLKAYVMLSSFWRGSCWSINPHPNLSINPWLHLNPIFIMLSIGAQRLAWWPA